MTKDKREGWLKELNVGDVVGFVEPLKEEPKGYGAVTKITPAGRIDVKNYRFDSDGIHSPSSSWYFSKLKLVPFTENHKQSVDDRVLKYSLTKTLENYDFNTLPLGQLKKIIKITREQ